MIFIDLVFLFFFLFSDSKLISLQLGVRFEQLDGVIKALSIEGEKKFLFDRCATGFYLSIRSNNSTGRGGEGYECSLKILLLHGYYVSLPCLYSDARLACSVERGSTVIAVLSGTHSRYIPWRDLFWPGVFAQTLQFEKYRDHTSYCFKSFS